MRELSAKLTEGEKFCKGKIGWTFLLAFPEGKVAFAKQMTDEG